MRVTCVNCGREGELVNRDPDRHKHLSKVYDWLIGDEPLVPFLAKARVSLYNN